MGHSLHYFFVLDVVIGLIDAELNITITTASTGIVTSARPTTLLKTIKVREEDFEDKNYTEDLFTTTSMSFRRNMNLYNQLWNWDYWCLLQPITGKCEKNVTKYYYNAQIDQCMPHVFTDCNDRWKNKGNKNRFDSMFDCESNCKGSTFMPVNPPEKTNICELQPNSGRCLGHNIMYVSREWYYYDVNEATCAQFVYGGCAGNLNKFDTMDECLQNCRNFARMRPSEESTEEDNNSS